MAFYLAIDYRLTAKRQQLITRRIKIEYKELEIEERKKMHGILIQ